jgi:hypothetical protein
LEATINGKTLQVEVKGLSGSTAKVELTPNEFGKFYEKSETYRLAVVLTALNEPELFICRYSKEKRNWIVEGGKKNLSIEERKGASISLVDI